jgi:acetyl esterase
VTDPALCTTDDLRLGGVPVRRYRPHGALPGTIVYYHGGGWVVGALDDFDQTCLALAVRSGRALYSVGYRLAPEHPFPAAADDAYSALAGIAVRAREPIVVIGESSGGNLAAMTALHARDAGGPPIRLQVLVFPVTDHSFERPSYQACGERGYVITTAEMQWFWDQYVPSPEDRPQASPLRAPGLNGLPPALVVVAECDPLRDEGVEYAQRLGSAGVQVDLREYPGAVHGFLGMLGVVDVADQCMTDIVAAVRAALD